MMTAKPLSFREACNFVDLIHRHHHAPRGHKFSFGAYKNDNLVGVIMVGRPVSFILDNGHNLEVNRLATDGTRNACSFLYGKAKREAKRLGYSILYTYTLASEPGSSLRAAGFSIDGYVRGRQWQSSIRPRNITSPVVDKLRWIIHLGQI